ncbi:BTB-domain-containing protein [Gigaspora margarita]|uniref:BTB-domain-containing protein n=1 Tax=Gigaspora margarita TaxID=4874 RepID=A0A8H3X0M1_GIGMA|nr:BTB-domain-containing protein [Gigaspora margarita]
MNNEPIQNFSNLLENHKDFDIKIKVGTFSNDNEVSLLDIFIAADEIGLVEISQQVEKCLLENVSAWKVPKDFNTICKYDMFTNLHETALNFKRNEALGYLKQGKFFKALEIYEEILKNCPHNAENQERASKWDLSHYSFGSNEISELSK